MEEIISTLVSSVLVPALKQGINYFKEEGSVRKIWTNFTNIFQKNDDIKIINDIEKDPENQGLQGEIKGTLKILSKNNPDLLKEIEKLLPDAKEEIKSIVVNNQANTQTFQGDNNKPMQNVSGSTITIN